MSPRAHPRLRSHASRTASGLLLALAVALAAVPSLAGEYSVSPLRIDLDRDARSAVVTLANRGATPIDFQISVLEWTQDEGGQDRYAPTGDIVFFPKILSIGPGESRVVRVGMQVPPATVERAFRLFIEPIPERSQEPPPPGASIAINLRFALPVFARPPKREAAAEFEGAVVRSGTLAFTLRNGGNVHLRLEEGVTVSGRDALGAEVFSGRVESRYVLAGMSRSLSLALPRDLCARIASLELTVRSDQLVSSQRLAVNRANCE